MSTAELEKRIKAASDALWPDREIKDRIQDVGDEFCKFLQAHSRGDEPGMRFGAGSIAVVLADILALRGDSLSAWMRLKTRGMEGKVERASETCVEHINEEAGI